MNHEHDCVKCKGCNHVFDKEDYHEHKFNCDKISFCYWCEQVFNNITIIKLHECEKD